jgi:uncharacterized membrane protein
MPSRRVASVDIVRGAVMVLMAIDHVRVYSGLPPGGPTPGIFFTRWITHFCAPAFVFLAGTSASLYGDQLGDRPALSRFLATRGLWLVFLELTILRLAWTFNLQFGTALAGVIWVLGWSMVCLAALVRLPRAAVAVFGVAIVAGHNLLSGVVATLPQNGPSGPLAWLWQMLYLGGPIQFGAEGPVLFVLYVLVPWVGVMALGYAFGAVLRMEPAEMRRTCLGLGGGAIASFLILRGFNLYGDPRPWDASRMPALLSFLNTTKYPASLLYLCMTLGPVVALLPVLENARGRFVDWLTTLGRVPLFYYLLHIPLIHLLALGFDALRHPAAVPWMFDNHPAMVGPAPDGSVWSLWELYLVFTVALVILTFACRWYAEVRRTSTRRWLRYL